MDSNERAQVVAKVGEPLYRIDWAARKTHVAELLAAGFSKPQIARYFDVSVGTIRYWLIGRDQRADRVAAERAYKVEQTQIEAQIAAEKAASFDWTSLLLPVRKNQTGPGP